MGTQKKLLWGNDSFVVAPGVYDALGARVTEQLEFEAVYMTGFGMTASAIAAPDLGLLTMTEMVARARQIVGAVAIPVIAAVRCLEPGVTPMPPRCGFPGPDGKYKG